MINRLTIKNYLDDEITVDLFNPATSGFAITGISGLSPDNANINMTEVATNDGAIYNSAKLEKRAIELSIIFVGDDIESIRQKTYRYFPIKKPVTLTFETDNRTAFIVGYVESNDANIFSSMEGTTITIVCPDPYFKSVGGVGTSETYFYGIEPLFEFPFMNNSLSANRIEFGSIETKAENVVVYDGDSEVGVTITIHAIGQSGDITIYNTKTREIMTISNTKIAAITGEGIHSGDDIVINTVKGNKYVNLVREGVITNILNSLSRDSDWFQLAKGDNIFAFEATSGASNLQFKIENQIIYEGL